MSLLAVEPLNPAVSTSRASLDSGYNTVSHPTPRKPTHNLPQVDGTTPAEQSVDDSVAQGSAAPPAPVSSSFPSDVATYASGPLYSPPTIYSNVPSEDGRSPGPTRQTTLMSVASSHMMTSELRQEIERRSHGIIILEQELESEASELVRQNQALQEQEFGAARHGAPTTDSAQSESTPLPDGQAHPAQLQGPPLPHMPGHPGQPMEGPPGQPFLIPSTRIPAQQATDLLRTRLHARIAVLPPLQPTVPDEREHGLSESELWWRERGPVIETLGYRLRPRYHKDWTPEDTEIRSRWQRKPKVREDYLEQPHPDYMDARRIEDNYPVVIKRVKMPEGQHELVMATALAGWQTASDPRNKTVLVHTISQHIDDVNKWTFMVMPRLRPFDSPGFDTMGEAAGFLKQVFEGLFFFHKHLIAHRDICKENILMDARPIFQESFHSIMTDRTPDLKKAAPHMTRTDRPTKYYFVNFKRAFQYEGAEVRHAVYLGKDRTVPEHQGIDATAHVDPFAVDVYCLGNMIRTEFLQARKGFQWIEPLVNDMTKENPEERPKMNEVLERYQKLQAALSKEFLRKRCIKRQDNIFKQAGQLVYHWRHKIFYKALDIPPIPIPYY